MTALEKLTPELESAVMSAVTMAEVEDLYRPYRPKRRTRASIAREKGLEPLAKLLFTGLDGEGRITRESAEGLAEGFVDPEKEVNSVEEAIQGAKDIIAEDLSDDAEIRKRLRERIQQSGALRSAANTEEDTVYRLYYEFQEPLKRLQSHRPGRAGGNAKGVGAARGVRAGAGDTAEGVFQTSVSGAPEGDR